MSFLNCLWRRCKIPQPNRRYRLSFSRYVIVSKNLACHDNSHFFGRQWQFSHKSTLQAVFQMQRVLSDTLFSCDPDTRMVYLQNASRLLCKWKSWKHELLQMFPKYVNAKKVIFWQASPRFLLRSCSGAPSSLRQMTKRASVRLFTPPPNGSPPAANYSLLP